MSNRLQIEIDNVKKFQPIGGLLASVLLLLTLSALSTLATTWNEPILAQSAPLDPNSPSDTPIPVRVDDRNNNNLWWLLILIPVGGLVWSSSRSRRQDSAIDTTVTPPIVPIRAVSSVDPLLLGGSAPQQDRVDPNLVVERERQRANDSTERDPVVLPLANGVTLPASSNGRTKEPLPATPPVMVPIDTHSIQSAVTIQELTVRHDEIPAAPLAGAPEPNRHPTEHIRLLEERLVVDRLKRKVGEVIVRKEVETRFVRVPIQREVLIVEQVEPEFKQLAVVDLGQSYDNPTALDDGTSPTLAANFTSTAAAIEFLKSFAARSPRRSQDLQLNIALEDADAQAFYCQWLEQRSIEVN